MLTLEIPGFRLATDIVPKESWRNVDSIQVVFSGTYIDNSISKGWYNIRLINPFAMGNTAMCGWRFEAVDEFNVDIAPKNISSRFSGNSETSELPENLEEIFPHYLQW